MKIWRPTNFLLFLPTFPSPSSSYQNNVNYSSGNSVDKKEKQKLFEFWSNSLFKHLKNSVFGHNLSNIFLYDKTTPTGKKKYGSKVQVNVIGGERGLSTKLTSKRRWRWMTMTMNDYDDEWLWRWMTMTMNDYDGEWLWRWRDETL